LNQPTNQKIAGIMTIQGLLCRPRRDLCQINGLSENKIDKFLAMAKKHATGSFCPGTFSTGLQVLEARKGIRKITTGSAQFDELLGGGIESQSITEFFGEFRTGEKYFLHTKTMLFFFF
jgi:meiotic recombination protein DMC1